MKAKLVQESLNQKLTENLSASDEQQIRDYYKGWDIDIDTILAAMSVEGMPGVDEVANVVSSTLLDAFPEGADFWDDNASYEWELPPLAWKALEDKLPMAKDFPNVLSYVNAGHENFGEGGYGDQNDFHPGWWKGVEDFFNERGIDADDGSMESFMDTTTNIHGMYWGPNKYNVKSGITGKVHPDPNANRKRY